MIEKSLPNRLSSARRLLPNRVGSTPSDFEIRSTRLFPWVSAVHCVRHRRRTVGEREGTTGRTLVWVFIDSKSTAHKGRREDFQIQTRTLERTVMLRRRQRQT